MSKLTMVALMGSRKIDAAELNCSPGRIECHGILACVPVEMGFPLWRLVGGVFRFI